MTQILDPTDERVPVRRSYSAEKNLVIYACVAS